MKASGWPTSEARSFAKQSRKGLGGDDRPYALGIWDLTRWVNDGLLMPFSLESNAKLPGKPHLEKRPRSFGKMNTVFSPDDRCWLGNSRHAKAPRSCLVRTSRGFGAHHLSLWCAPFVALVRTKTAGDAHQNSQDPATKPGNIREKANGLPFPQVISDY